MRNAKAQRTVIMERAIAMQQQEQSCGPTGLEDRPEDGREEAV